MTQLTPQYAAALQPVSTRLQALCDAIDSGDTQRILAAQKELTATTEAIWSHIENDSLPGRDKALARLLAEGALKELPGAIQDPANYPRIQRELRQLRQGSS
jgi:hypothetical protein